MEKHYKIGKQTVFFAFLLIFAKTMQFTVQSTKFVTLLNHSNGICLPSSVFQYMKSMSHKLTHHKVNVISFM